MDAMTHDNFALDVLIVGFSVCGAIVSFAVWCMLRVSQMSSLQEEMKEQRHAEEQVRGLTNETFNAKTWALDDAEELAECETVISDTVVRV